MVTKGHRFDLRFLRPFRADFSIKKSSSFFPLLIAATSQRGLPPRPAQVSPDGARYFGGTFLPFKTLRPLRTTLRPPTKGIALSILLHADRGIRVGAPAAASGCANGGTHL